MGAVRVLYPSPPPNLTAVERKLGYAREPLDTKGKVLNYNFSAHSGCGRCDRCMFSQMQRIGLGGLRWAAQYDLARRGGLLSGKTVEPKAVGG